ncbi:NAD(P)H-dependent oxidoreductase [Clostridium sp.]|uniref:NAD(P)H-dependent oxidoreductase n=1 Tax=Clostridium sp. TaxID=1506 RepID=UPI0026081106|nr:NAD(P)H-dependent oxidoreductase [Clostridium sp.]
MKIKRENVIDIFNFRFATKEFNGEIIPREDMNMIMETARLSPSSFGLEPWKFLVIENKNLIKEIAEVSWGFQRQAPTTSHLVVALTRAGKDVKYDSEYVKDLWINTKGVKEELFERTKGVLKTFQNENLKADENYDELLEWSKRQSYIALGNMMTSAAMIGIDSCAIEGFDKEKVEEILIKKGLLNKEKFDLTYLVAFGYRKENPSREKARLSEEKVIEWVK